MDDTNKFGQEGGVLSELINIFDPSDHDEFIAEVSQISSQQGISPKESLLKTNRGSK